MYTDDTDFMARSQSSLKEVFLTIEGEARMGLRTNQEKRKHLITSQNAKQCENKTIGNYISGVVQTFTYLGSSVSCNNDISQKIKQ
jgi:hypothetical protein